MKTILLTAICALTFSWLSAQSITQPPSGDNQKAKVLQWIGPVSISISYSSPDVTGPDGKSRKDHIWGEVVHYGYIDQGFGTSKAAPWRAGANENTVITFSHDVNINGKDLKAGAYGLFLSVAKDDTWTWIFSKNTGSWGSYFYDEKEDALRVAAQPEATSFSEYLTYGFDNRKSHSASAYLHWENKRIGFTIDVPNVNEIYLGIIRNELRNSPGFDPRNFLTAAQFCITHKINLEEALTWAEQAMDPNIGGTEDFNALSVKSQVLMALGKQSEASQLMDKAIKVPGTSVNAIHQYARSLLGLGMKEKAMEVFQYNAKAHPEEKFTTYVGLARGYTALGDKKNAIKNWEIAIKNLPDNQKGNKGFYEGELKKLQTEK
jgi:tetratricopeptide (TPR) repeat protein